MSDQFDPYLKWLGISPKDQPPNHYRLLGIDLFMADPEVIEHAADRQMAHIRSFQSGKNAAHSQRLLNEIANAKVCLLDRERKLAYDEQLKRSSGGNAPLMKAKALPQDAAAIASPAQRRAIAPVKVMPSIATAEPTSSPGIAVSSAKPPNAQSLARRRRRSPVPIIAAVAVGIAAIVGLIVFLNSGDTVNNETTSNDNRRQPQQTIGDDVKGAPAQQPTENVKPPLQPPPVEPVVPKPPEAGSEPQPAIVTPPPDPTTVDPSEPDPDPPPQNSDADRRLAIPDDEAQQTALNLIREIFQSENEKAKTPDEKRQFARLLFQAAIDTQDDAATRFVLLRVARDIASSSGDTELVCDAVDKLAEIYRIDGLEMKAEALTKAAQSLRSESDSKQFVLTARTIVQTAADRDRYDLATELSASILEAARKMSADDIELRKEVVALGKLVEEQAAEYQAIDTALAVLNDNPADTEANLVVGKYLCLEKGEWESGLPMLAMGNDPGLKAAAEYELAKPSTADDQMKLGDAWWELADGEIEPVKTEMLKRAAVWYERAMPKLTGGLIKTKLESRLDQIAAASEAAATRLQPDRTIEGKRKQVVVYLDDLQERDFRVAHFTLGKHGQTGYDAGQKPEVIFRGQKVSHSLSTHPGDDTFAYVNYDLAGKYNAFAAIVGIKDARLPQERDPPKAPVVFKVIGDDRLLWQSHPIGQFSQGQECSVDVANVQKLQLRVECTGGGRYCHAVWINPRVIAFASPTKDDEPEPLRYTFKNAQELNDFDLKGDYRIVPSGGLEFLKGDPPSLAYTKTAYSIPIGVECHVFCLPDGVLDIYTGFAGIDIGLGISFNKRSILRIDGQEQNIPHRKLVANRLYRVRFSIDDERLLVILVGDEVIFRKQLNAGVNLTGPVKVSGGIGHVVY